MAVLAAGLAARLVPAVAARDQDDRDLSTKALVAATAKYVAKYQQDFAFLIADEAYSQTRTDARGGVERRLMQSEVFLSYLPADNEWLAVRDVIQVDATPVKDRDDLRALLAKRDEMRGLIAKLIARNARFNIGRVSRNFNEPTLPLLLFSEKRVGDIKFDRKSVERTGNVTLATLAFTERGRPTLVRGPNGATPAKGEIVVEAGTGVVRRTTFELAYTVDKFGVKVRLTTDYAKDEKIGLWLPSVFNERYESTGILDEVILCQAIYTNYRRFDVVARIKK